MIRPTPPKKEEDIAEFVYKSLDVTRQLEIHGEGYNLSRVLKITALKSMMSSQSQDMFEFWEQDDRIKNEKSDDVKFSLLLSKVIYYASQRRLEATQ